jgi:hypothetical protein
MSDSAEIVSGYPDASGPSLKKNRRKERVGAERSERSRTFERGSRKIPTKVQ